MKLLKNMAYELYENYLTLKTKVLDIVEGTPAVILIGENHSDAYHPRIEARIIEKCKPKFVLFEGVDSSEEAQKALEKWIYGKGPNLYHEYMEMSLKDVGKKYNLDLELLFERYGNRADLLDKSSGDPTPNEGRMAKLIKKLSKSYTITPDLLDKPLGNLTPEERVIPQLIILRVALFNAIYGTQNKVETSQPTDLEKLAKIKNHLDIAWQYNLELPVYKAIRKVDATPAGCDVDRSNVSIGVENLRNYLKKFMDFSMSPERESTMASSIKRYAEKTARPVVAIVGKNHLRRDSKLLEELEKSEVKYRAIKLPDIEKSLANDLLYSISQLPSYFITHPYLILHSCLISSE